MKKDAMMMEGSRQGSLGMRAESEKEKKAKAQGVCGNDIMVCGNGVEVYREPGLSCRFGDCEVRSSSLAQDTPTYKWTGVSIDASQNFCQRMTPILSDSQDLSVPDCTTLDEATCENHYEHIEDGKAGDIKHCQKSGDLTLAPCGEGALHNCTWSFYMEDLIKKHTASGDNCASKLLESKRSLDGLLHSVEDVYNQLMQWNAIVQAENSTIRRLLTDQQTLWGEYMDGLEQCHQDLLNGNSPNADILIEMQELRSIANPDVRSAVNRVRTTGYQSDASSDYSVDGGLPGGFVEIATEADSQARAQACNQFLALMHRQQKKRSRAGKKELQFDLTDCHTARDSLNSTFSALYMALGDEYDQLGKEPERERAVCQSARTYEYKSAVEGLGGIDDLIQDSAGKIHEAQGEIARLEPMLHDVERAVDRMRVYVENIKTECTLDNDLGDYYNNITRLIVELAECPGRNNFTITVPHWTPETPIGDNTPVPTPWFDDPKADAVRAKL